jgi:hypothetical protein
MDPVANDDTITVTDSSATPEETLEKSYQAIRKKIEADALGCGEASVAAVP